ncbi:sensor histidine kinase [Kineococcus sp. NUM-3379]
MGTRVRARAGRRRALTVLTALLLALLALVDVVVVSAQWPALLFLAVTALAAAALLHGGEGGRDAATAAAVVLSCAGSAVLAAAAPAASFGLVETAVLLLLLVSRWRRAAGRRDRVLTGALVVALLALPLRTWSPDTPLLSTLALAVVAVMVAVASALRSADQQRRVAVEQVRVAEREEIARELHDVVAHHVTGIVVATQAARAVAGSDPAAVPPAVGAALASIETAGTEALTSMRRLVGVLRAGPGAVPEGGAARLPTPGLSDLADLVRRFRGSGSAEEVRLTGLPDGAEDAADLPVEVQAAVYRVVQESLTNVARHARGAARVDVEVTRRTGEVVVRVASTRGRTGPGEGGVPGGGFGIVGMRERVTALGGTLAAGPAPGGGWCVRAAVPVPGGRVQR